MPMTVMRGPAAGCGCPPPPAFLSARKQPRICFPRNHRPLQRRGALAWSADGGNRWRTKLKAQEPEQVVPSCKPLFTEADFVDPQAPTSYIDILNELRLRPPSSQQQKLMCEEQELCEKALQQRARNFVDGIIQFISSEKEYYKFIIIACRESTNMIMELGFISSYNQDEILDSLDSIQDDITNGRFEWRENKDVRSNIVETLVERVGEPARKLDATISQYVQKQTILRLWFHDSADKIITQIEKLQVELVLLALRNQGFVLPRLFEHTGWILLGDLILSKLHLLSRDVSRLRSCKMRLTLSYSLPYLWAELIVVWTDVLQDAVVNFANIIIGDITIDLAILEREFGYWISYRFLTQNDKVIESVSLLKNHVSDLDKFTATRKNSLTYNIQDPFQRFVDVYKIVQQILEVATDFAKNACFNQEKVQSSPSNSSLKTSRFPDFHTIKGRDAEQSENKKHYDMSIKEFRSHSDDTAKRLIDWLIKHQAAESMLKFCKFKI